MSGNKRGARSGWGSVRKLPSGQYQARYTHPDTKETIAGPQTFTTKAAAESWLAEERTLISKGDWNDPALGDITFAEFAETWVEEADLRDRTRPTYRAELKHITTTFGDRPVASIQAHEVRAWHADLRDNSGLHPNTVAKVYRQFRKIMSVAVDDGRISRNPCKIKGAGMETVPESKGPPAEVVLELSQAINPRYEAMVLLAGFCSLRFGECAGLQRADVDLDAREIHVQRQAQNISGKGWQLVEPKTPNSVRVIPIPENLVPRLAAHMETFVALEPDAQVFTSPIGSGLRAYTFRQYWLKARAAVGAEDYVFHDLRHTAGTLAAKAGGTVKDVQTLLGHSTHAAAIRYIGTDNERLREVVNVVSDMIPLAGASGTYLARSDERDESEPGGKLLTGDFKRAGDRDRTGIISLEGWGSAIELHPRVNAG